MLVALMSEQINATASYPLFGIPPLRFSQGF